MGSLSSHAQNMLAIPSDEELRLLSGSDFWRTNAAPRLGLGSIKFSDGPNGVRGQDWTQGAPSSAIPCATALGASFDTGLVERLGRLLAHECHAKGVQVLLAPTMNIHRYMLCGRNFESFSEDPYTTGMLAAAYVCGLQAEGVGASPKHFLGNEAENGRRWTDSCISPRAMREIYLEPFRIVIKQANPWCLMTAYNAVNGSFCSESKELLAIVRDEWKYNGAIVSDWFGTYSTTEALQAGLDLEMPGPSKFRTLDKLHATIKEGHISAEKLQNSIDRIKALVLATGRASKPGTCPAEKSEEQEYGSTPEKKELLRDACRASMVLLKNDGNVLPLTQAPEAIAVYGQHAMHPAIYGGGSASLKAPYVSSPWDAIKERYPEAQYCRGVSVNRLIRCPVEAGLDVSPITLDWFNGHEPNNGNHFFTQTLKDTQYMLVEDIPAGLLDTSDFCTVMKFQISPRESGSYDISVCGPGNAVCRLDGQAVFQVTRDLSVSTEDYLFDRSKLESRSENRLALCSGTTYTFEITSWSSKHQAKKINREFFIQGCRVGLDLAQDDNRDLNVAANVAKTVSTAVLVVGTGPEWESEGFDRDSLCLPRRQNDLIRTVARSCPGNTIVVLNTGSAVDMSPWIDDVAVVLQSWFPGMEFGNALVDILSGNASPCGRLPTTFWDKLEHSTGGNVEKMVTPDKKIHYTDGVFVGYRQDPGQPRPVSPRFCFGHGLTFTSYQYLPRLDGGSRTLTGSEFQIKIELTVKNTGHRSGEETILLFVKPLAPGPGRPEVELRAFAKTRLLQPGESDVVSLVLGRDAFHYWEESRASWKVDPGRYAVLFAKHEGVGTWYETEDVVVEVSEEMARKD